MQVFLGVLRTDGKIARKVVGGQKGGDRKEVGSQGGPGTGNEGDSSSNNVGRDESSQERGNHPERVCLKATSYQGGS